MPANTLAPNVHSAPAPVKVAAPAARGGAQVVAGPPVKAAAPSAPVRLTPIQKASSAMGAAKAANATRSSAPLLPGLGLSQRQAQIENNTRARLERMPPATRTYTPTGRLPGEAPGGGVAQASILNPVAGAVRGILPTASAGVRAAGGVGEGGLGLLGRFASEAAHAPIGLLEGGYAAGSAGLHDLAHNPSELLSPVSVLVNAITNNKQSQLGQLVRKSVANDPVVQSIAQGSLKPISQDPFQAALDATAVYGGAGDILTAGARAGETAARAAGATGTAEKLANFAHPGVTSDEYIPGYTKNAVNLKREASNPITRNLVKPVASKVAGALPGMPGAIRGVGREGGAGLADFLPGQARDMRIRAAADHGMARASEDAAHQNAYNALEKRGSAMPKDRLTRSVSPLTTAFGGTDGAGLDAAPTRSARPWTHTRASRLS